MVPIILTLPVVTWDLLNNPPTHLRVVLSEYLIARLQKMHRIIICNNFGLISEYNDEPQYLKKNSESGVYRDSEFDIETETINVKSTHFYWQGNIKPLNTHVKSEGFFFDDLKNILKVRKLPIIEMPKYINDKNPIIQYLAKIRMESND